VNTNEVDPRANQTEQPGAKVGPNGTDERPAARFFGRRGQAAVAPRRAPTGPQGQPLPAGKGSHQRGFVLVVAALLGIGGWILYNSARAVSEDPKSFNLGSDTFQVSNDAKSFAAKVERDGPRLYQALQGDQDLWVTFTRGNWYAFQAWVPDRGRSCPIQWVASKGEFYDCDMQRAYDVGTPDSPLTYYQTIEENNRLAIDLRTKIPPVRSS
jgi:hypothetical protein